METKVITKEDLEKFINEDTLTKDVVYHYLKLYVGESNWDAQILSLKKVLSRQYKDDAALIKAMRNALCMAILMPAFFRSSAIGDLSDYLVRCGNGYYNDKLKSKDWSDELKKVVKRDIEIDKFRREALVLGVIDPIEYQPYCRQAYNWLYQKAEETGCITPDTKDNISKSMEKLVHRYGGMVISNMFTRHQEKVDKIVNWRTGYFVERAIFNVYKPDEVCKIKQAEINDSPQKLVKKIK